MDAVWSASGGNPRILDALLHDAAEAGVLSKRNGIWILLGAAALRWGPDRIGGGQGPPAAPPAGGTGSTEAYGAGRSRGPQGHRGHQRRRRRPLAPGPAGGGGNAVVPAELSLWNGLLAQTIRNTISVSRSLQLLEKTRPHQPDACCSGEGRARSVEWALECGLRIPDPELIAAHGKHSSGSAMTSARMIAAQVQDPARCRCPGHPARALFNDGDYADAATLLDGAGHALAR